MRIHHIGIISKNIEKDLLLYSALGYEACGTIVADEIQGNKLLFLINPDSNEMIELIEPYTKTSTVKNLPPGSTHICYEVNDIDNIVSLIKTKKLGIVFTEKIKAPALGGRDIVFAMLKNKTILEFVGTVTCERLCL